MSKSSESNGGHIVTAVVSQVKKDYVVTYPKEDNGDLTRATSVTFSLSDWQGDVTPRASQVVRLTGIQLFEKGWRAAEASPVLPVDEHVRIGGGK